MIDYETVLHREVMVATLGQFGIVGNEQDCNLLLAGKLHEKLEYFFRVLESAFVELPR